MWRSNLNRRRIALWTVLLLTPLFLFLGIFFFPTKMDRLHDLSPSVYDKDGELLHCSLNRNEKWQLETKVEDVDAKFINLLIHTEDKRFYTHPGVDVAALLRASLGALTSFKVYSGGSTLTMQVVRLLEPRPRTLLSKGIEILKAMELEGKYSKKQILEMYLTLAPYGGNIQGVKAASLHYFGKSPHHLSQSEAALLVALPQSPTKLGKRVDLQKRRRDYILSESFLPPEIIKESTEDSLPIRYHSFPRLCSHVAASLKTGHHTTTISKPLQERLEHLLKSWPTQGVQSIAAVIADKSGKVRAYMGSKDFFDHTIHGQVDVLASTRSPGSTLKPFVYGLAFEEGWLHPQTIVKDHLIHFNGYSPTNFHDVFHGDITITEALQQSLNTPVVSVLEKLGPQYFLQSLENAGISLKLPKSYKQVSLPIALGGVGIRLLDLAALFNTLNQDGVVTPLSFHKEDSLIQKTLLSKRAVGRLTKILTNAPLPGNMVHQPLRTGKIAFKTGTSSSHRDALAVGVNGEYVVLVWFGRADGAPILGQVGLKTAAPLLLTIFDSLLGSQGFLDQYSDERQDPLPLQLKYMDRHEKDHLQIHFPMPESTLIKNTSKSFAFTGGVGPYTIFVNKKRTTLQKLKSLSKNLTPGFHHILMIDAQGRRAETHFRVR